MDQDSGPAKLWNDLLNYSYMFKNNLFKYEEEERFVITIDGDYIFGKSMKINDHEPAKVDFYNTKESIRPCLFLNFKDKLPINKIYVSPLSNNETALYGIKRFLDYYGYEIDVIMEKIPYRLKY